VIRLNLRYVARSSFVRSGPAQLADFAESSQENCKLVRSLANDDVIAFVFVSLRGDQVRFVLPGNYLSVPRRLDPTSHEAATWSTEHHQTRTISWVQQRCINGIYTAETLGNLAELAGIHLKNYPLFNDFYQHQQEQKERSE
jgi:hypothetical protein